MNQLIRKAVEAVAEQSEESAQGLTLALDSIGALSDNIPDSIGREALIEVIAPALSRHPANSDTAFTALHHSGADYTDVFASKVAPTICNLFLFQ